MNILEAVLFITAVISVIALGIWKSRSEELKSKHAASDYFLAGRGLSWWLVGFSLIAANISTEQFVGMSGGAADRQGLAIASWEWIASITLVIVAFWFLPKFLRTGIYTIPEFLEYRFDTVARLAMSIPAVLTLVFVNTSTVIFSGAKFVSEYYADVPIINNLTAMCWAIAILAALYVFIGGLKACAWTDLIWGSALVIGGAIVMFMAFNYLGEKPAEELILTKVANSEATVQQIEQAGSLERFMLLNDGVDGEAEAVVGKNAAGGKLHMVRPTDDPDIPWTALLIGMWIPNFFYWGLNQFIVQRTLGSKSLAEGQRGIVFAAFLKLIIPFVVVIPGIMAFNLFSDDLRSTADGANTKIIASASTDALFKVDEDYVSLNPEKALEIYTTNLTASGAKLEDLDTGLDSMEMANRINNAAAEVKAANPDLVIAGTLKGYDYDAAFPVLVRNLIKPMPWISWFVLAALCGAVISSLASMLNSASTLATMDLYAKFTGEKDQAKLVAVGRTLVIVFVLLAASFAPKLDAFRSIFAYIQEFQGFISPGILAVFVFGFFSPKTPRYFGVVGIVTSVVVYGALLLFASEIAFLNRMAITVGIVLLTGLTLTILKPLDKPVEMPVNEEMDLKTSPFAKAAGVGVVILTISLYIVFW
ncbi:sodium/solute symporter [Coraliomargarita sp. SDUM461003]|uniref:Sodium/solute symporter n=1 Tax=Thalassobacterium maritimum TaxID=3041265 RepID=A0ABU1AUT6_9BACT|nr:sodium/solute symporter [Coraliomargarita sp. SDUM461003]MDQ8207928.1 sodium/solute symporter [Coraliomargarita sp. SDUM461003]